MPESEKEVITVNIDNRKRLPVTLLLKALGARNNDEILELLGVETVFKNYDNDIKGCMSAEDVYDEDGDLVVSKGSIIDEDILANLYKANPGH